MIKLTRIQLPEFRRIKIGGYSDDTYEDRGGKTRRKLEKWDHFKITQLEREHSEKFHDSQQNFIVDEEMTKLCAHPDEKDKSRPRRLGPCHLPFDTIEANLHTAYGYYTASKAVCLGDGIKARRYKERKVKGKSRKSAVEEVIDCVPELCPYYDARQCRPSGVLNVIFPQTKRFGGVYVFRTKSRNSIESMLSQMVLFISQRGSLAGVPFNLVLNKKRQKDHTGSMRSIEYVTLEFEGTYDDLIKLPRREPVTMIDLTADVIRGQHLLVERSKKILEAPEDFYDDAEPVEIEVVEEGDGDKEEKKEEEEEKKPEEKQEEEKKEEPKTETEEKPEVDDKEPVDAGEYATRDWAISSEDARAVMDAVNTFIGQVGRKHVNTRLAEYGTTVMTLNSISEANAGKLLSKVRKSDERDQLLKRIFESLNKYQKLFSPKAKPPEAEMDKIMAVKKAIELDMDSLNEIKELNGGKLLILDKKLNELLLHTAAKIEAEKKKAKEAEAANAKKKEEEESAGAEEDTDGAMNLF